MLKNRPPSASERQPLNGLDPTTYAEVQFTLNVSLILVKFTTINPN